jgi:hypothetical protein
MPQKLQMPFRARLYRACVRKLRKARVEIKSQFLPLLQVGFADFASGRSAGSVTGELASSTMEEC